MKYVGSKNRLAKDLVPIIQKYIDDNHTENYMENFVGGANIIDKINCKNRYGSDIHKYLIALLKQAQRDTDEIIETISQVKDKFSQLYVVFTDYTGKIEQEVVKERREKDPILFGTFQDKNTRTIIDRFYFLGDWIDEYCDLTLDKMVNETIKKTGGDIRKEISTPQDIQELKAQLDNLDNQFRQTERKAKIKQSIFSKIRSVVFK